MGTSYGKLDEVSEGCKEFIKQRLKVVKVIHSERVELEVYKNVNAEAIIMRLSTKSKEVPLEANDFFLFLVEHQHLFECAFALLKSPEKENSIAHEMTEFLQQIKLKLQSVRNVLKAKGNALHLVRIQNTHVGLVQVKGYKIETSGEFKGCIIVAKETRSTVSNPMFANDIVQLINLFLKHSNDIDDAISSLIGASNDDTPPLVTERDTTASNTYDINEVATPNQFKHALPNESDTIQCPKCGTSIQTTEGGSVNISNLTTASNQSSVKPQSTSKVASPSSKLLSLTPRTSKQIPGIAHRVVSDKKGLEKPLKKTPDAKSTTLSKEKDTATKRNSDDNLQKFAEEAKQKDDTIAELQLRVTDLNGELKDLKQIMLEATEAHTLLENKHKKSTQKLETLQIDFQNLKTEAIAEKLEMENVIKTLKQNVETLQHKRAELKGSNASLQSYVTELELKNDKLEKDITYSEKLFGDQQALALKSKDDVVQLEAKLSDTTNRLAAEMNTKVSANESSLENISIKCRPMNVIADYNVFVSDIWLNAKQAMDKKNHDEEMSIRFLCDILMISSDVATRIYAEGLNFLTNPFGMQPVSEKTKVEHETKKTPDEVMSVVGDNFRRQAETIDIIPLKLKVIGAIVDQTKKDLPNVDAHLTIKQVDKYAEESARLAWKMAIQRPAMLFDQSDIGARFQGEKIHPLAWGSKPSKKARVRYYQYPSLLHGKSTMLKGRVFVY